MTKLIKMSLVAAVAVAGLSSTAAAKPLEEAIKNVDVSGMIRLRFDSETVKGESSSTATDFDTELTLKSKISDRSTAVVKVEADKSHSSSDTDVDTYEDANGEEITVTNDSAKSTRLNAELSLAYLSTKFDSLTVNVGRQGIPGPFDDAQGGDGVLATLPAGPVTLAAGYFTTTSAASGKDAYELALMGNADMVSYDLWYASVANTINLVSAHAAANVAGLDIDAMYTKGTLEDDTEATLAKLFVSGSYEMVNLTLGVAVTGDDNDEGQISIDNDGDAGSDIILHELNVGGYADATAFIAGISTTVSDVTVGVDYLTVDYADNLDADELDITASYKLDTNLKITGIYAMVDNDDNDDDEEGEYDSARIEVKYTF